jgi:hypothetical protein
MKQKHKLSQTKDHSRKLAIGWVIENRERIYDEPWPKPCPQPHENDANGFGDLAGNEKGKDIDSSATIEADDHNAP